MNAMNIQIPFTQIQQLLMCCYICFICLSTYHLPVFCLNQACIMTLDLHHSSCKSKNIFLKKKNIFLYFPMSKKLALIQYYLINSFYSNVSNYAKIVFRIVSLFGLTIQRSSTAYSCHVYLVSFSLELSQHITFLVNDILEVPASCLVVCPTIWTTHKSNCFLLIGFRLNILAGTLYREHHSISIMSYHNDHIRKHIMAMCPVVGEVKFDQLDMLPSLSMLKIPRN